MIIWRLNRVTIRMSAWRPKPPTTRHIVLELVKKTLKISPYWTFVSKSNSDQWIPINKGH